MNVEKLSEQLNRMASAAPHRTVDLDAVVAGATRIRRRRRMAAFAAGLVIVTAGATTGALTLSDGRDSGSTIAPQPLPEPTTAPASPAPPTGPPPDAAPVLKIIGASTPGALPAGWSTAPTRPNAYFMTHAVVGGAIVQWSVDRGDDSRHSYSPEGAAFDVAARTWSLLPNSPIAGRYRPAAAGNDHLFFVWGGDLQPPGGRPAADGATYDLRTNTWHRTASAPLVPGVQLGSTWDGRQFVVVGQRASAAYDPQADTWTLLPSLPTAPTEASVVQVGDRTYVIGAYSYYLTRGTDAWTPIPSPRNALVSTLIAATDGVTLYGAAVKGFVEGSLDEPINVDRFDTATATWVRLPAARLDRVECSTPLAVTPRNVFVACGSSALYDRGTGTWTEYGGDLRLGGDAVAVGRAIVVLGDPTLIYSPP